MNSTPDIPDVIIVDYADILAPEDTRQSEKRHQVDETWKALRRLSQEWHALVIWVVLSVVAAPLLQRALRPALEHMLKRLHNEPIIEK